VLSSGVGSGVHSQGMVVGMCCIYQSMVFDIQLPQAVRAGRGRFNLPYDIHARSTTKATCMSLRSDPDIDPPTRNLVVHTAHTRILTPVQSNLIHILQAPVPTPNPRLELAHLAIQSLHSTRLDPPSFVVLQRTYRTESPSNPPRLLDILLTSTLILGRKVARGILRQPRRDPDQFLA